MAWRLSTVLLIVTASCVRATVLFEFYRMTATEWDSKDLAKTFRAALSKASYSVCKEQKAECGGAEFLAESRFQIEPATQVLENTHVETTLKPTANDALLTKIGLAGRANISEAVGGYLVSQIGSHLFSPPPPHLLNAIIIPITVGITAILLIVTIVMSRRYSAEADMMLDVKKECGSVDGHSNSSFRERSSSPREEAKVGRDNVDNNSCFNSKSELVRSEEVGGGAARSQTSLRDWTTVSVDRGDKGNHTSLTMETTTHEPPQKIGFTLNGGFHNKVGPSESVDNGSEEVGEVQQSPPLPDSYGDPLAVNVVNRGGLLLAPLEIKPLAEEPVRKKKKRRRRKRSSEGDEGIRDDPPAVGMETQFHVDNESEEEAPEDSSQMTPL